MHRDTSVLVHAGVVFADAGGEKGTMFYERMKNEDRILKLDEIGRLPGHTCYIKPRYCTPEEMVNKVQHIYREFYS